MKDTEACPFVGTSDSFHDLISEHLGTVPVSFYPLPDPNKIPSHCLSDVGIKAEDQNFPLMLHKICTGPATSKVGAG